MNTIWGFGIAVLGFLPLTVKAQDTTVMSRMEDSLLILADSFYKTPIPELRVSANTSFGKMLVRALEQPGSYNYPFTRLQQRIHIIYPEDKSFRIFNWVLSYSGFGRHYYGAVQMADNEQLVLHPLKDVSSKHLKDGEDIILSDGEWYGCEYYHIKTVTGKDGARIYTLLGYNNDGFNTTKKIVDVLSFPNKAPVFGLPVFVLPSSKDKDDFKKRFILEYKKGVQVTLNYDSNLNMIVFDRLISEVNNPSLKGTYVPAGQTDALEWQGSVWHFTQNAIAPLKLKDGQAPLDGVMQGGR